MKTLKFIIKPKALLCLILMSLSKYIKKDSIYVRLLYFCYNFRFVNISNPITFTEKIQWLKLHDRNPLYKEFVDKIKVKEYVKKMIGEEYIVPTLAIYNKPECIDIEKLPNHFVLKTNNGGGSLGVVICKNKENFNLDEAKKILVKSLNTNIFTKTREWPYKDMERKIFAELLLSEEPVKDYKFYCFNGIPKYCQVIADRETEETIDFFDEDWNHMPFRGLNCNCQHADYQIACPLNYKKMLEIAQTLSSNIPFVRVDLYNINGRIYFGEMTFYPASGMGNFTPKIWNKLLGDMLIIPTNVKNL